LRSSLTSAAETWIRDRSLYLPERFVTAVADAEVRKQAARDLDLPVSSWLERELAC